MSGDRFAFGRNWQRFLDVVDEKRIGEAERSLTEWLGEDGIRGRSFLDAGCGSGLFSLAALRLGAARIHSFDYDTASVACAEELRRRYGASGVPWAIERADVLDESYVRSLGTYDVVYSWGVLHHTGDLRRALYVVALAVTAGGRLFVAVYNDQGLLSRAWKRVKRLYNVLPRWLRGPYAVAVMGPRELRSLAISAVRGHPQDYVRSWNRYKSARGMSRWRDLVDWVGGYPFEVARPEDVFALYHDRGFELERLRTCGGGLGCNEFLLRRTA